MFEDMCWLNRQCPNGERTLSNKLHVTSNKILVMTRTVGILIFIDIPEGFSYHSECN